MMTFDRYASALKMRDIIRRMATQVVNIERPLDKVGRVVDVDRGGGTAKVVYAGDEVNSLRVSVYPGLQPPTCDRVNGVGMGSIVRVSGPIGSRYISEILSDGPYIAGARLSGPFIAGGGSTENTLVSEIAVQRDAPAASSSVDVGTLTLGSRAANIMIDCELVGASDSFIQSGRIVVDWFMPQGTPIVGTVDFTSSSGVNLSFIFSVTLDQLTITLSRGTGTRVFDTANVMMHCVGTNIRLNPDPVSGA